MPIKIYNPITAGRRRSSVDTFSDITKKEPEKSLIVIKKKSAGRNNSGKITVRHQGGGARRYIRIVDFKQDKYNAPANVEAIEYDPGRGARIALIKYPDNTKGYILCPLGLQIGDKVMSYQGAGEIKVGNRMPLEGVPVGTMIYNIELWPGRGGELIRGAGLSAQLMSFEDKFAQVKLPSGEIRKILAKCFASIGQVGNPDHRLIRWGKAGRMRHRGIRPTVRGKAMNPVDHPHGGGEGHCPIGLVSPKTPWGKKALGVKTRDKNKWSNRLIIKRRK